MNQIRVAAHGLNREEPADFIVNRPYGIGQFLLVRFHSPMEAHTVQGQVFAEPGDCILFAPEFPQWYRGYKGDWMNDWMHLEGNDVGSLAARYHVPLNSLLTPQDTSFFSPLFTEIAQEQYQAEDEWEQAVALLAHQLLLKLGRALNRGLRDITPFTVGETEHLLALRHLRRRVHAKLEKRWTVKKMANEVGLSASHFAMLYRQAFGISPVEDLLRARLQYAEILLTNRAMPVGEAATKCGFSNIHYFSHLFHQRIGCAPRDYHRRTDLWINRNSVPHKNHKTNNNNADD